MLISWVSASAAIVVHFSALRPWMLRARTPSWVDGGLGGAGGAGGEMSLLAIGLLEVFCLFGVFVELSPGVGVTGATALFLEAGGGGEVGDFPERWFEGYALVSGGFSPADWSEGAGAGGGAGERGTVVVEL
jgi:hypothetical protein